MTIGARDTKQSQTRRAGAQTSATPETTVASPAQAVQRQSWSFHNAAMFGSPIGKSVGSEYLDKLMKALAERFASANGMEVTLIPIDRNNDQTLAFSVIIVCVKAKEANANEVAYHTLIIEATGEKPKSIYETINNRSVEIKRFAGDASDPVLAAIVAERVMVEFPNHKVLPVDSCVVPSELFDPANPNHIHALALNAACAAGTEISVSDDSFVDLNIAEAGRETNLTFNLAIVRTQEADAVQQPMRSDVAITFTSSKRNAANPNQTLNSGDREVTLSKMNAFVETLWAPVAGQGTMNAFVPQVNQPTQKFAARLVITSAGSEFAFTPAAVLLSLYPAAAMRDDSNWIQAYKPTPVGGAIDVDLHDVGALNYEGRLPNTINPDTGYGRLIDTKSDDFNLVQLGGLISSLFQPGLMISVDVPRCGPQSWYSSWLAAAAGGNPDVQDMVIAAADNLTNGLFSKKFPAGAQIFVDVTPVHLGTWRDRNGTIRDIRDFDYVAMANIFGPTQPQVIAEYSDTFFNTSKSIYERLAHRAKLIEYASGESAVFTGLADRCTFSTQFIDALLIAGREAGLSVRTNTPLSGSDFQNNRGVASFAAGALLAPGQNFGQANVGFVPQYGGHGVGYSRYNRG